MQSLFPYLPVYVAPSLRGQCRLLRSTSWSWKSLKWFIRWIFIIYTHTSSALRHTHIHTYTHRAGSNIEHVHNPGQGTSVMVDLQAKGTSCIDRNSNLRFCYSGVWSVITCNISTHNLLMYVAFQQGSCVAKGILTTRIASLCGQYSNPQPTYAWGISPVEASCEGCANH